MVENVWIQGSSRRRCEWRLGPGPEQGVVVDRRKVNWWGWEASWGSPSPAGSVVSVKDGIQSLLQLRLEPLGILSSKEWHDLYSFTYLFFFEHSWFILVSFILLVLLTPNCPFPPHSDILQHVLFAFLWPLPYFFCNPLSSVGAACWNVDWSCWLGFEQSIIAT